MSSVPESPYQLLEQEFVKFKTLQAAQKQRGLNDFNVFTTLLSKSDEVRLHSRFIAALLDVSGKHYQGSLFLKNNRRQTTIIQYDRICENLAKLHSTRRYAIFGVRAKTQGQ